MKERIQNLFQNLAGFFLQGLLYVAPLTVTVYIFTLVFGFFDGLVPIEIPGLGILIIIAGTTFVGFVGRYIITQPISAFFNRLLKKAPLVKMIYSSIKDLVSAFVGQEKKFNQPVLVKVSKVHNLEKIGFITSTNLSDLGIGADKVTVFFPMSYSYTGELFVVPADCVTPLNIPAADAMKFIISGGITRIHS